MPRQLDDETARDATVIAMAVRNAMEDFHHKHLSDEQMAELNPIIRKRTTGSAPSSRPRSSIFTRWRPTRRHTPRTTPQTGSHLDGQGRSLVSGPLTWGCRDPLNGIWRL